MRKYTSEYQVVQCVLSLALVCSCEASDPLDRVAAISQQALASAIRLTGIYASAECKVQAAALEHKASRVAELTARHKKVVAIVPRARA